MKKPKRTARKSGPDPIDAQADSFAMESDQVSLWRDPFIQILIIVAGGFLLYFNTLMIPFTFDDFACLVGNPVINSFNCFPDTSQVFGLSIHPDLKNNLILRPLAYFTFALNYHFHGLNLFGYHLVNLLLHLGCALLVYSLVYLTLKIPVPPNGENPHREEQPVYFHYLPLFTALLFLCHPLQTQAVNYVIQRFVPLATFFYLSALALYIQSRCASTPRSRLLPYILALIAAVLAMESKEIAFTLPAVMVLFEFIFFSGKLAPRVAGLIPFLLTMAIIPGKLLRLPSPVQTGKAENVSSAMNLVNYSGVSPWDYLTTQFGVITTYLRLLLLPVGQNLDYDYPLQHGFFKAEVLLPLSLLLGIVAIGVYLLKRSSGNLLHKIVAFGIFWFFITLSVESSIVPIDDLIFEHRVYLPSIGFFMALLAGAASLINRLTGESVARSRVATSLLIAAVLSLSAATMARNQVWRDEVTLWSDVVRKSPNKARAHVCLGEALLRQGRMKLGNNGLLAGKRLQRDGRDERLQAAVNAYREAIRLGPDLPVAHEKLAEALTLQKNFDEALRTLATSIRLNPKSSIPYVLRGEICEARGDLLQARSEYLEAIRKEPSAPMPHGKLADIYAKQGNTQGAIKELEFVMRVYPDQVVRKKLARLKRG